MNRFTNSWTVFRQSLAVLLNNPSLAIFPIISGICLVLVAGSFLGPAAAFVLTHPSVYTSAHNQELAGPFTIVFGFLFYFVTFSVMTFFNAALVACAHKILMGQPATLGDGIRAAASRTGHILAWSAIAATVGQLIRAVQQRGGIIGKIAGMIVGIAWSIVIFFVLPIIVIEGVGPVDALKASAERLKRTWGESLILNAGLGFATFLFVILPLFAFGALAIYLATLHMFAGAIWVGLCGVLWLVLGSVVNTAMSVIHQTALYMYSADGSVTQWYSPDVIQGAFGQRQSRWGR